jgi:hypothetical protein
MKSYYSAIPLVNWMDLCAPHYRLKDENADGLGTHDARGKKEEPMHSLRDQKLQV